MGGREDKSNHSPKVSLSKHWWPFWLKWFAQQFRPPESPLRSQLLGILECFVFKQLPRVQCVGQREVRFEMQECIGTCTRSSSPRYVKTRWVGGLKLSMQRLLGRTTCCDVNNERILLGREGGLTVSNNHPRFNQSTGGHFGSSDLPSKFQPTQPHFVPNFRA